MKRILFCILLVLFLSGCGGMGNQKSVPTPMTTHGATDDGGFERPPGDPYE